MSTARSKHESDLNEFLSPPAHKRKPDVDLEFIVLDSDPAEIEQKRKAIRAQAARSSASIRKETISRKDRSSRLSQDLSLVPSQARLHKPTASDERITLNSPSTSELSTSHNFQLIYNRLHHELFNGSALYYPALLAALTHTGSRRPILLWIKDIAIRGISLALGSDVRDANDELILDVSISTLAGWDLTHGDDESLQAHMRALRILASRRSKSSGPEDKRMAKADSGLINVVSFRFIRTVGHDLALLAWKDADLPVDRTLQQLGASTVPSGLVEFEKSLNPVIFNILLGLSLFDSHLSNAAWRLRMYIMQLSAWTMPARIPGYHPDYVVYVAIHSHLRIGLIQYASCLYEAQGDMTAYDDLATPQDGREMVNSSSQILPSSMLSNTVYRPLLTWSLVSMCAASQVRFESRMRLLADLFRKQSITSFDELVEKMSTIAYRRDVFDARMLSVWSDVQYYSAT